MSSPRRKPSSLAEAVAAAQSKPESNRPPLQENVCHNFHPHPSDDAVCAFCGHEEVHHSELKQHGGGYRVVSDGMTSRIVHANRIDDQLTPATYVLHKNQSGFFLEHAEPIALPKKIYGSAHERSERILKAYDARCNKSMGVICSGRPGTGKTILAKLTACKAVATGIPVIVVRQPFAGSGMSSFLESLPNKCLIFVDEIEKVYSDVENRDWLLTVLDGTVKSQHLWIMTCNDPNIGEAFSNRPSRIRYHYKFEGLEEELIDGMISEGLQDKSRVDEVRRAAQRIHALTPDVLMTIIDEVNIFGDAPKSFLDFLNVNSEIPDCFTVTGFVHHLKHGWQEAVTKIRNKDAMELVKNFISEYNHYGLESAMNCYEGALQYIPTELIEVEQSFAKNAIVFNEDGTFRIHAKVYPTDLPYALREKQEFRINWQSGSIDKIEMDGSTYVVHSKEEGCFLRLTPIKTFTRYNSNAI